MLPACISSQLDPACYECFEHLGAAYAFLARRLSAHLPLLPPTAPGEYDAMLSATVTALRKSLAARAVRRRFRRPGEGEWPPAAMAMPRTWVYRTLGDALLWLGRASEGRALFSDAVREGVWSDPWCRPAQLHATVAGDCGSERRMEGLGGFLAPQHFSHVVQPFEARLPAIAAEFLLLVGGGGGGGGLAAAAGFTLEAAGLHSQRTWTVLPLAVNGTLRREACTLMPTVCAVLAATPATRVLDGQTKVSVMQPSTYVKPHAGPTNARLRMHCTLALPRPPHAAAIRVARETRGWRPGRCLVFDESCEHEVWQNATSAGGDRAVLIVDFVNPRLASFEAYMAGLHPGERDDALRVAGHKAQYAAWHAAEASRCTRRQARRSAAPGAEELDSEQQHPQRNVVPDIEGGAAPGAKPDL